MEGPASLAIPARRSKRPLAQRICYGLRRDPRPSAASHVDDLRRGARHVPRRRYGAERRAHRAGRRYVAEPHEPGRADSRRSRPVVPDPAQLRHPVHGREPRISRRAPARERGTADRSVRSGTADRSPRLPRDLRSPRPSDNIAGSMRIAVLKETAARERRVAMLPDSVGKLVKAGLEMSVERGAGLAAGATDEAKAGGGA